MGGPGGTTGLRHELLRRKPVGSHDRASTSRAAILQRSIGTFQLTMFGVGATIGTGIFFVLSSAVPEAGPAVSSRSSWPASPRAWPPSATRRWPRRSRCRAAPTPTRTRRSARSSRWASAACLLLEYGVSTAAVAVGWSGYLNEALRNLTGIRAAARDPRRAVGRRARHRQPARGRAGGAVHAPADPGRQRVRPGQRDHGRDQADVLAMFIVIALHRVRRATTSPTSRRSGSRAWPPRRARSSSRSSAWTPCPPRATR